MARTVIPATSPSRAGVAPPAETAADPTNGNVVQNASGMVLLIRNGNGTTAQTVTFITPGSVEGYALEDEGPHSIPANESRAFAGFPTSLFGTQLRIDPSSVDLQFTVYHPA